jgi:phosphatidylinositol alpha-1,6-mannosyltransferase
MRILVLLTDAFGGHGGIAQYNRDFLTAVCSSRTCEAAVAVPRIAQSAPGPLPEGLTYVSEGLNGKLSYALCVLRLVLGRGNFDLVISSHINLLPLAYLASRGFRCPLALLIYGAEAWQSTRNPLTDYLVSKIGSVVSISSFSLERFMAWSRASRANKLVIPNAVDLSRLSPGPKNRELLSRYGLNGNTVLVTLGRLATKERAKGVDQVLELLPTLRSDVPDVRYLVIGDGNDRARLEEKARSLGIADRAVFSGYIPESEKLAHYRLADAYVMPSRLEGFGFVFLEAMAAGIPVVASRIDGSREAVRDGMLGTLVDPRDPEDIRRGILKALSRPRGVVPEGLDYFAYERFEERVHQWLDGIQSGSNSRKKAQKAQS